MTEIKKINSSHVSFEITFTDKEWQVAWDKTIAEASEHVEIAGFRKGKAPQDKIIDHIGEQALKNEALTQALSPKFVKFIEENKLDVVSRPEISVKTWEPVPTVEIKVAIKPEINLKDIEKVSVKMTKPEIKDKDVQKTIDDLKKRFKNYSPVERGAKDGDKVEIDFDGKTPDGVALDGTSSKNHPVILGEGQLLPDFEKNLQGKKAGEEFEFQMKFPKDYHGKNVADKDVIFKIKMHKVEEGVLPTDDELGKKIFGTDMKFDELKKRIADDIQKGATHEAERKTEDEVIEKLAKAVKVEIPEEMLVHDIMRLRQEREYMLAQRGMTIEHYLKQTKTNPEKYEEQLRETAEQQAKVRLVLDAMIKEKNIQIDETEKKDIAEKAKAIPVEQREHFISYQENAKLVKKILSQFIK